MRQHINNNWIVYALLAGLLVCGLLFVATPVMAQTETNTTNNKLSTLETFGAVGGVGIVLLLALVSGALGIGRLQEKVKNNKEALNKHEQAGKDRVDKIDKKLDSINKEVSDIKKDLNPISIWFNERLKKTNLETKSPLQLTETGKENFEKSGCKRYLEEQIKKGDLLKRFEGLKEPYKIHSKATEIITEKYAQDNDPEFKDVYGYLYYEGVSQEEIIPLMAVGLRNMICEEKGIVIQKKEQEQVQK